MNKLKNTEKLIKNANSGNDPHLMFAFENMLQFYGYWDYKDNTNHCGIIYLLYTPQGKNFTKLKIARQMHIDDNTLRRYRLRYADCFCYFLNISQRGGWMELNGNLRDA